MWKYVIKHLSHSQTYSWYILIKSRSFSFSVFVSVKKNKQVFRHMMNKDIYLFMQ